MMLLLDFAVWSVNRSGRKKNHGDHYNNNTDREYLSVSKYLSVSNNNNNNKNDSTEIRKIIKDSEEFGIF